MAKKSSIFSVSSKAVDPALDALFSASAGPVKAPEKSRYAELVASRSKNPAKADEADEEVDDEELSSLGSDAGSDLEDESEDEKGDASDASGDSNEDSSEGEDQQETVSELAAHARRQEKKRKRKQDELDDLEGKYLDKLADDDDTPVIKRRKEETQAAGDEVIVHESLLKKTEEDSDSGSEIVHESLSKDSKVDEIEKAGRTVFLSNVSVEAITSRKAKKALLAHLSSVLDSSASPAQKIESIRFRSVAFSTAAVPKRAAYINKEVMDATTKSTNAYVVYSTPAAVRAAVTKLNGTTVLDRHLRVDSVAHPSEVDHRRCVFVGNLGFVDDETVLNVKIDEEGKEQTEKRKRTKVPMDVEEGLWRQFGERAGKVESVRVVRDSTTRVGKGIAYVQFYDANSVEAALLLNGKKFPPMLPRELRVNRCKAPYKTARAMEKSKKDKIIADGGKGKASFKDRKPPAAAQNGYVRKRTAEEQTLAGRAEKLLGRSAAGPLREKERLAASEAARARISKSGKFGKRGSTDSAPPRVNGKGYGRSSAGPADIKTPEAIVFEGRRASSRDGKPRDLKMGRKGSHKKGGVQKRPFKGKRPGK